MDDGMPMDERKSGGAGKYIAIGCLSVVFIAIVGMVITGVWVANNWKTWASDATTTIMANGIRDTELPLEDQRALIARVELVGEEFKSGALTLDEVQLIGETLLESPLLTLGVVEGMSKVYIEPSALTEEEKATAKRLTDRLGRGMYDKRIAPEELEGVLKPLSNEEQTVQIRRNDEGRVVSFQLDLKPPEQVTADELRAFMAEAESLLEQKAIPDEPFEVDIIEEFDRAIEAAVGRRIVPEGEGAADPVDGG